MMAMINMAAIAPPIAPPLPPPLPKWKWNGHLKTLVIHSYQVHIA